MTQQEHDGFVMAIKIINANEGKWGKLKNIVKQYESKYGRIDEIQDQSILDNLSADLQNAL